MKKIRPKYKQIIEAAVLVISENGYHGAQVSKIAKRAGVADGTIYLYFQNKEDILVSVFREKMGEFVGTIQERIAGITSASEKLLMLIEMHLSLLSENYPLAIVTQLELRQSNKDLRLQINHVLKDYLQLIDRIIEEGISSEEFRGNLHVRMMRQLIFGAIDEVMTNWVMSDGKYNVTELAPSIHEFFLKGCCADSYGGK